jgi:hypothetical protein
VCGGWGNGQSLFFRPSVSSICASVVLALA